MKEKNMTALVSCFARAYHSNYRLKIYNDLYAKKILSDKEYHNISDNMVKGMSFFDSSFKGDLQEQLRNIVDNYLSPSILARCIYTQKSLENDKKLGARQYLILASGYDTSAYNNSDITCFELDKKKIIKDKISRLKKTDINYSKVKFVEGDLLNNKWIDRLMECDFDQKKKTFCSLLGITYYLTQKQFEYLLRNLSSLLTIGSTIIFDYPNDHETYKEILNKKLAKKANEEMKTNYTFKKLERILEKNNFLIYENLNNDDINKEYFYDYNTINYSHKILAPKGVSYCLAVKR